MTKFMYRLNTGPGFEELTHCYRDNMAAISQTTLSNAFFFNENVKISIKISPRFLSRGPINYILGLVRKMVCSAPVIKTIIWTTIDLL